MGKTQVFIIGSIIGFVLGVGICGGIFYAKYSTDTKRISRLSDEYRHSFEQYKQLAEANAIRVRGLELETEKLHTTIGELRGTISSISNSIAGNIRGLGEAVTDIDSARQEIRRVAGVLRAIALDIQHQDIRDRYNTGGSTYSIPTKIE